MDIAVKVVVYVVYNQFNYVFYSSYIGYDEFYSSGYSSVLGQDYDDFYSYVVTDYGYRGYGMEVLFIYYMVVFIFQFNYEFFYFFGIVTVERLFLLVGLNNIDFFYYNLIKYFFLYYIDFL